MRSSVIVAAAITFISANASSNYTLGLGQQCTASTECAGGADCYAVNSMLITRCGNFQATCSSISQCATNTCINGFCSGALLLPLGSACNSSSPCQNGASCYAVNSMLIPRCGNTEANCTWDGQCAFNSCSNGFCSGPLSSSSSFSSRTNATSSTTFSSQSTATAPSTTGQGTSTTALSVNGSATSGSVIVTTLTAVSTAVVAGQTSPVVGGSTGPSQTATVQNGGTQNRNVVGTVGALGIVVSFMFLL